MGIKALKDLNGSCTLSEFKCPCPDKLSCKVCTVYRNIINRLYDM